MTNACSSGVDACMNVARSQKAPIATGRWRSPPSVTRNGSDRSSEATAVRSFPNRRATAGAASAATAVNTWAMLKNVPIWALVHVKRFLKYRFMNGITSPAPEPMSAAFNAIGKSRRVSCGAGGAAPATGCGSARPRSASRGSAAEAAHSAPASSATR